MSEGDAFQRRGRGIRQFMWAYQPHFLISVKVSIESSFKEIGFLGNPEVLLVGFQVAGEHAYAVCVEPEDGPFGAIDLSGVTADGRARFAVSPEHQIWNSDATIQRERMEYVADSCRADALADALASSEVGQGSKFFCSRSVQVGDYEVHVVVGVDEVELAEIPQLKTVVVDRINVTPSLLHAVVRDVLGRAARALWMPDPGRGLQVLGAEADEIARSATNQLVYGALMRTGQMFVHGRQSYLNAMSALPYERRWGRGRIVFAKVAHPAVTCLIKLREPVQFHDSHAVRKLVEASGAYGDVLSDGEIVYGLGFVKDEYDPETESIFIVTLTERGIWNLSHADETLVTVRDGVGLLPSALLNVAIFSDAVNRLLPDPDTPILASLAEAAGQNEHGAMLIISSDAAGEAKRLSPQAWSVESTVLSPQLLSQLTGIDGGVLIDPQGNCHAIGVILDGIAGGIGDPARGSRYNSAIRYLGSNPPPAVVVVYSTDGTINVLPQLMPLMDKGEVESTVVAYVGLSESERPDLRAARSLWDKLKKLRFYLSADQCAKANRARRRLDEIENRSQNIRIIEHDLKPDSRMNASYWK